MLLKLGITSISAGLEKQTRVGMQELYMRLEQFEISDDRSPLEIAKMIQYNGYEPVWKDWFVSDFSHQSTVISKECSMIDK